MPAPPRKLNVDLPAHFDEAFARALSKQPSQRYATGMEFVAALAGEDLETSLADLVPEPIPEAQTPTLAPKEVETQAIDLAPARRRRALMWAVPAAAGVALAVEIGLLVPPRRPREGPRRRRRPSPPSPTPWSPKAGWSRHTRRRARLGQRPRGRPLAGFRGRPRARASTACASSWPGYAPTDFSFPVTARTPASGFNFNLYAAERPPARGVRPAGRADHAWTASAGAPRRSASCPSARAATRSASSGRATSRSCGP